MVERLDELAGHGLADRLPGREPHIEGQLAGKELGEGLLLVVEDRHLDRHPERFLGEGKHIGTDVVGPVVKPEGPFLRGQSRLDSRNVVEERLADRAGRSPDGDLDSVSEVVSSTTRGEDRRQGRQADAQRR